MVKGWYEGGVPEVEPGSFCSLLLSGAVGNPTIQRLSKEKTTVKVFLNFEICCETNCRSYITVGRSIKKWGDCIGLSYEILKTEVQNYFNCRLPTTFKSIMSMN